MATATHPIKETVRALIQCKADQMTVMLDDPPTRQEVIDQLDADTVRRFLYMLDVGLD